MKSKELIKILEKDNWYQVRQKGSHKMFKHPNKLGTLSVPDHGSEDLKKGTLHAILKQAGLE